MTFKRSFNTPQPTVHDEIDLKQLIGTLLDGKWFIILATALFFGAGVVVALLSTPIYRADALIQIEEKSGGVSALTGELGDIFSNDGSAVTEIEVLKSRMVVGQTVDELGLTNQITPNYVPLFGKGISRLLGSQPSAEVSTLAVSPSLVGKPLTLIVQPENSFTLFDHNGEHILSGVVNQLVSQNGVTIEVQSFDAETGDEFTVVKARWLDTVKNLQRVLSVSERGKQSGILSMALEGEDPQQIERILQSIADNYESQNIAREAAQAEKSLSFLENQLPEVRRRLNIAEQELNGYRQQRESVDLSREAEALLGAAVELESRLNDLDLRESELSQRFTTQHPSYKTLLENRATLLAQREALDLRIQELPETQREILSRSRELEVNQGVYTTLLNRVQELTVVREGTVGYVRILDNAQAEYLPVKPKKPLIVVLATLLGGMIGMGYVLVASFLNPGLTDTNSIEAAGLTVYGNVPYSSEEGASLGRRKRQNHVPLAIKNPADLAIEAIRSLRTSIHFALLDSPTNVIMITGAAPGAGKSFLSSNLALTLATSERKVLLIDGDMRRGHLHREFNVEKNSGLSDYLLGANDLESSVSSTAIDALDIITCGVRPPNPAELLIHSRFEKLLAWASTEYDVVIIDTPPILAVTDAAIVGALSGVNLMVGRYGEITQKEIEISLSRFDSAGVKINAFVFNAVQRSHRSSYGYGYYQYDYNTKQDNES